MKWTLYFVFWTLSFCPAYATGPYAKTRISLSGAIDQGQSEKATVTPKSRPQTESRKLPYNQLGEPENVTALGSPELRRPAAKGATKVSQEKNVKQIYSEIDAAQ